MPRGPGSPRKGRARPPAAAERRSVAWRGGAQRRPGSSLAPVRAARAPASNGCRVLGKPLPTAGHATTLPPDQNPHRSGTAPPGPTLDPRPPGSHRPRAAAARGRRWRVPPGAGHVPQAAAAWPPGPWTSPRCQPRPAPPQIPPPTPERPRAARSKRPRASTPHNSSGRLGSASRSQPSPRPARCATQPAAAIMAALSVQ